MYHFCRFKVHLVKTSCGDAHNIGLDKEGKAYSLPSPLDFDPFPSDTQHKVHHLIFLFMRRPINLVIASDPASPENVTTPQKDLNNWHISHSKYTLGAL